LLRDILGAIRRAQIAIRKLEHQRIQMLRLTRRTMLPSTLRWGVVELVVET